jgi:hypothetical protein
MLPNASLERGTLSSSSSFPTSTSSLPSTDFGKIEGYVTGPTGFPAVGASVVAYNFKYHNEFHHMMPKYALSFYTSIFNRWKCLLE